MEQNQNPFYSIYKEQQEQRKILEQILENQKNIITPNKAEYKQGLEMPRRVLGAKSNQMIYQNIDKIPHKKIHGKLYFCESELQEYIASEGKK